MSKDNNELSVKGLTVRKQDGSVIAKANSVRLTITSGAIAAAVRAIIAISTLVLAWASLR